MTRHHRNRQPDRQPDRQPTRPASRRGPGADLFSLIAGPAFAIVAVLYLLEAAGTIHFRGRLVIPLVLIALGIGGLAGTIRRRARSQRGEPPEAAGSAAATTLPDPAEPIPGADPWEDGGRPAPGGRPGGD